MALFKLACPFAPVLPSSLVLSTQARLTLTESHTIARSFDHRTNESQTTKRGRVPSPFLPFFLEPDTNYPMRGITGNYGPSVVKMYVSN